MTKLAIVVGDYGGGTVEDALKNGVDLNTLRSGDSADARVLNEMIRQDPSISKVITLPIARQFSPNSAGVITREAVKWAFEILEKKEFDEVAVVANVAPGIKSLKGNDADNKEAANLDREPFVTGTVTKGDKKIVLGSTSAFLEGEGHTLGAVTALGDDYQLSEFKRIGGEYVTEQLKINGQFRSRWALAYMAAKGEKAELAPDAVDVLPIAKEQQAALKSEIAEKDEAEGKQVFEKMKDFIPVVAGDATKGFVTVLSEEKNVGEKQEQQQNNYPGQFLSGMSYDGNETAADRKIIASLSDADKQNYRLTRQASLAANMALEFDKEKGAGNRRIVIDSLDAPLNDNGPVYEATLTNNSKIITTDPRLLALVVPQVLDLKKDGKTLTFDGRKEVFDQARDFKTFLADKAIENDPYRNVKLATPFAVRREEIAKLLTKAGENGYHTPKNKAIALTVVAKTGNLTEERTIYCTPHKVGSFGTLGHPRITEGSTRLDATGEFSHQAEIFTVGCPTAGNVFTVIPGVTSFEITAAKHIDLSLLETPGTRIIGKDRKLAGEPVEINKPVGYNPVHGAFVNAIHEKLGGTTENQPYQPSR